MVSTTTGPGGYDWLSTTVYDSSTLFQPVTTGIRHVTGAHLDLSKVMWMHTLSFQAIATRYDGEHNDGPRWLRQVTTGYGWLRLVTTHSTLFEPVTTGIRHVTGAHLDLSEVFWMHSQSFQAVTTRYDGEQYNGPRGLQLVTTVYNSFHTIRTHYDWHQTCHWGTSGPVRSDLDAFPVIPGHYNL